MQCTGEQVTNESCYFDCKPGYNFTGSPTRVCQVDNTWTGEAAECPPLECGALTNPENGVVIAPCYNEFLEQCTVMCEEGYLLTGSTLQSCNLTGLDSNEVKWTEPPTCKGAHIASANASMYMSTNVPLVYRISLNKCRVYIAFNKLDGVAFV